MSLVERISAGGISLLRGILLIGGILVVEGISTVISAVGEHYHY
jgi:hypothetical protein